MPLNNTAMVLGANAIKAVLGFAQLHSAAAGGSGTSNLTSAARQAATWTTPTGPGSFGLSTPIVFTGGAATGAIYSVTLWSASSGGTFYGEFPITSGDLTFNAAGVYTVTAIDLTGSAT